VYIAKIGIERGRQERKEHNKKKTESNAPHGRALLLLLLLGLFWFWFCVCLVRSVGPSGFMCTASSLDYFALVSARERSSIDCLRPAAWQGRQGVCLA
jgi:hypothetical protein